MSHANQIVLDQASLRALAALQSEKFPWALKADPIRTVGKAGSLRTISIFKFFSDFALGTEIVTQKVEKGS